ncbi:MAG TPA: SpoIIE family protein phosphatase [Roseiflexaceae bacterium]|nr:SpoIIE family protein phosphatase [Roseiflexaceae bacterium]HMP39727.1 SpoIIE family protein phosphatase [Roseiflexaceae bacterium]
MMSDRPAARSVTLCIVLSEHLTSHFTGPLAEGAVAAAIETSARLIFYSPPQLSLDRTPLTLADLPLLPPGVDGYLLPESITDEVVVFCRSTGASLLTYGGERPGLPSIGLDNRAAARVAVEHLIGHGYRRIVHLMGLPLSSDARERLAGYRDALHAAGIAYDPALVLQGAFRATESRAAIESLLADGVLFEAIFAANDLSARGAIDGLHARGLRIPHDIAIVGFDDSPGSSWLQPSLTTIRQSMYEIGRRAILALMARTEGSIRIDAPLVVRLSCGCLPRPIDRMPEWADELALRLGAGRAPEVEPHTARQWVEQIDLPIDNLERWITQLDQSIAAARRRGWYMPALRDALAVWRAQQIDAGLSPARIDALHTTAKDRLSLANEHEAQRLQTAREDRMNMIAYLIDLLRARSSDEALETVLQVIVLSGARRSLAAQRLSDGSYAGYVVEPGQNSMRPWICPSRDFPTMDLLGAGESLLFLPVRYDTDGRIGLIGIVESDARGHLDLDDLLLRSVGTFRSIRLLNETLRELDVARSVQLSLLPRRAPVSADFDIAGDSRTARLVGGDLYGYYMRPEGAMALAVGDVAGKGMPAALLMSACVAALAGVMQSNLSPGRALQRIHETLLLSVGRGQNAAIGLVYLDGSIACVANAGAIAPILRNTAGVELLDIGGLPLGTPLSAQLPYREQMIELAAGDMLILSSDGIVEAMNPRGELFGFDRLLAAVADGPTSTAAAMIAHLYAAVDAFVGDAEIHDDMALVVVRRVPQAI